ncbi:MAG: type I methionyl aminopeptidase [Elusimicrobia bacterium]|nr:type I methionyl aminopeptidase [Elusimicrobiota bacterium]
MSREVSVIDVKSAREIALMRESGRIASVILSELATLVKVGLSTEYLDEQARRLVTGYPQVRPAFLGYRGFPASLCVSVNAEVVHGVPRKNKVIKDGDLVSLDWGVEHEGYFGDCATTVMVGQVSEAAKRLTTATAEALEAAIRVIRPGATVGDIGHAVEAYVKALGMNVVKDFVGHGIGRSLHEDPAIPNWGRPGEGAKLVSGMTIAVEPMVTLGSGAVVVAADGWTARTKDGALAAHFEHTLLVTDQGCEILTKPA